MYALFFIVGKVNFFGPFSMNTLQEHMAERAAGVTVDGTRYIAYVEIEVAQRVLTVGDVYSVLEYPDSIITEGKECKISTALRHLECHRSPHGYDYWSPDFNAPVASRRGMRFDENLQGRPWYPYSACERLRELELMMIGATLIIEQQRQTIETLKEEPKQLKELISVLYQRHQ